MNKYKIEKVANAIIYFSNDKVNTYKRQHKKEDIEICFFDGEQVKYYDVDEYDIIFKDFLAIENDIASLSNEIITIKGKNETV